MGIVKSCDNCYWKDSEKCRDCYIHNRWDEDLRIVFLKSTKEAPIRDHNPGSSDYAKHKIQPWDIWKEYNLNPWDADIIKRVLRKKVEVNQTNDEARRLDYEKIIHVAQERIRQIDEG